jgi:Holliday junction resolvase RusA-like endonuclease
MKLTIHVAPVAKARAKTVVNHGMHRTYTPDKTAAAEDAIRLEVVQTCHEPPFAAGIPLELKVSFICKKPRGKKVSYPVCRPDIDNYLKLLLDAGNGNLWADDSQIVKISAEKVYGEPEIRLELNETV